mmetsp:Transcript_25302/g.58970  ORF Transcript_25302/g.58970 Transcript_25302/m.58970 type:complete len:197 (+) Transcript_25302:67-657(+)
MAAAEGCCGPRARAAALWLACSQLAVAAVEGPAAGGLTAVGFAGHGQQPPPRGDSDVRTIMDKINDMGRNLCKHRPDHESCKAFKDPMKQDAEPVAAPAATPPAPSPKASSATPAPVPPQPAVQPQPSVRPEPVPQKEALDDWGHRRVPPTQALAGWGQGLPREPGTSPPPGELRRWGGTSAAVSAGETALLVSRY